MDERLNLDIYFMIASYFDLSPFFYSNDHNDIYKDLKSRARDLGNFCLVSKTFRLAFQPQLDSVFIDNGSVARRRALLREYANNRGEANRIRAASICSWSSESIRHHGQNASFYPRVRQTPELWNLAETVSMDRRWADGFEIEEFDHEYELALLLCLLPNLEVLQLRAAAVLYTGFESILVLMELREINPGLLSKLQSIKVSSGAQGQPSINPWGLDSILSSPNLRELSMSYIFACRSPRESLGDQFLQARSSDIQVLKLGRVCAEKWYLRCLLSTFKSLKEFQIEWRGVLTGTLEDNGIDGIVETLMQQQHSLKKIVLDGRQRHKTGDRFALTMPVGSFRQFINLETLEISAFLLTGQPERKRNGSGFMPSEVEKFKADFVQLVIRMAWRQLGKTQVSQIQSFEDAAAVGYDLLADIFPSSLQNLVIYEPYKFWEGGIREVLEHIVANHTIRLPGLQKVDLSSWRNALYREWMGELQAGSQCPIRLPNAERMVDSKSIF